MSTRRERAPTHPLSVRVAWQGKENMGSLWRLGLARRFHLRALALPIGDRRNAREPAGLELQVPVVAISSLASVSTQRPEPAWADVQSCCCGSSAWHRR